ncbi:MAG TPA: hypothetical protein VFQ36_00400 [Ktedonobacteraceae bacterium]|nr:hypothetical protein [Ktedonobacteraceae bacterium]
MTEGLAHPIAITYREACDVVENLGILPLSSFIPGHPSLVSITRPEAWHTGMDSDPWLWRDRFAMEGVAAYGRFLGDKPLLISREMFPIAHCSLAQSETVEERYAAGLLAKATLRIYNCIRENDDIDVKSLRKLAGMQHSSNKSEFDRSLNELQNTAEVVISGIAERLNPHGNKSGWNSTCYLLADTWMERHGLVKARLSSGEAKTKLYAWIEPRWEASAVQYLKKRLAYTL